MNDTKGMPIGTQKIAAKLDTLFIKEPQDRKLVLRQIVHNHRPFRGTTKSC